MGGDGEYVSVLVKLPQTVVAAKRITRRSWREVVEAGVAAVSALDAPKTTENKAIVENMPIAMFNAHRCP
jgi:hypothetical protein